MKITTNQKKLLNALLDKYERSKTYEGINQVLQNFAVTPADIWSEYDSDFADIKQVKDFETEMEYLQDIGLIKIQKSRGIITKITACSDKLSDYYELLQRKQKKDIMQEYVDFFESWCSNDCEIIVSFCKEQLERVRSGKKPVYAPEVAVHVLDILDFLAGNKDELLERELSILMFGDSKVFENKYRKKVCKIISTYADFKEKLEGIDDEREQEKVILEEHNIYVNPSYVYLKGNIHILLKNGTEYFIDSAPVALSSEMIRRINSIIVENSIIVTVENLTSFNRINEENCTYIYLAGYHNTEKQALLQRIHSENPEKKWYHFGDIDPDGFYILEHLRRGTGIDFMPMFMSTDELKVYNKFCKPLVDNDRVKANNLIQSGYYTETLQYMLDNNCKLEQEIISFTHGRII